MRRVNDNRSVTTTALLAIVALDRLQGAMAQQLDGAESGQSEHFASHQSQQRNACDGRKTEADRAQRRRAREQFLDEVGDRDAERKQHEPVHADQNSVAQRQRRERLEIASAIRLSSATSACSDSGATICGSAMTTRGSSTRNAAGLRLGHCNRSPNRNCIARSRRMCGNAGRPSATCSSCGGRKRTKRKSVSLPQLAVRPRKACEPGSNSAPALAGRSPGKPRSRSGRRISRRRRPVHRASAVR